MTNGAKFSPYFHCSVPRNTGSPGNIPGPPHLQAPPLAEYSKMPELNRQFQDFLPGCWWGERWGSSWVILEPPILLQHSGILCHRGAGGRDSLRIILGLLAPALWDNSKLLYHAKVIWYCTWHHWACTLKC